MNDEWGHLIEWWGHVIDPWSHVIDQWSHVIDQCSHVILCSMAVMLLKDNHLKLHMINLEGRGRKRGRERGRVREGRERGREGGREGEGVRGVYVRKIGTYLCSSIADNWVWMECVGMDGACGWSMWGWVEHVGVGGVGMGGACGGG